MYLDKFVLFFSFVSILIMNQLDELNVITVFCVFFSLVFYVIYKTYKSKEVLNILLPSNLLVLYYSINIIIGFWAYQNDYIYKLKGPGSTLTHKDLSDYVFGLNVVYISLVGVLLICRKNNLISSRDFVKEKLRVKFQTVSGIKLILVFIIVFLITEILSSFSNGPSGLIMVPRYSVIVLTAIYILFYHTKKKFLIYSVFVVVLMSITQLDSKREVVFVLLMLYFLRSIIFKTNIVKQFFVFGLIGVLGLYLIILLAITRGFGNFDSEGVIDSNKYIIEYVTDKENLSSITNNLESPTVFMHCMNGSIEMKYKDPTFHMVPRLAFFFLPNSILNFKPPSYLDEYTSFFSESIRSEGKSVTSGNLVEFLWSFSYLGIVLFILFYRELNRYVIKLLNRSNVVLFLFISIFHVIFLRGSGLDLFIQYVVVFYVMNRLIFFYTSRKVIH